MSITEKLFAVQQNLIAPKDQFNSFGKYKYRSCEGILESLKPILKENKLVVLLSDEVKEIGGRVYVEATATAIDTETGETVQTTASAREEDSKKGMDASQVTGASSSYARKYALNGLFAIDDNKDSDATNTGDQKKKDNSLLSEKEGKQFAICADCGAEIYDQTTKNGGTMSVADYVAYCMRTYERPLCKNCRSKK